jgi:UPF0755 protein
MIIRKFSATACLLVVAFVLVFCVHQQVTASPSDFPIAKNFVVDENETLGSLSARLEDEHYITSSLLFRAWVSFLGHDRHIKAGGYMFDSPKTLGGVVEKFVFGKPDSPLLSVTIPEGSTSFEIAQALHKVLPTISIDIFGETISKYEADGKLFPSTYFLLPSLKEEDLVKLMLTTFEKKVGGVLVPEAIKEPLKDIGSVLSMAAILEGEARKEEDMKIIAGILLARLKMGMPLQVDVAKETYKAKGLPAVPINNPGLMAIMSVLHPTNSTYLYYITGKDGLMYYAKTFEEHKRNIKNYLK